MTLDLPHMIATARLVFAVIWAVDPLSVFDSLTRSRRAPVKFGAIFAAILVLNLIRPYGATA